MFPSQKSGLRPGAVGRSRSTCFLCGSACVGTGGRRAQEPNELGETAAQVVIEAQNGSRVLRRLTYAIALLTLVNTGFIIYSVLK